MPTTTVLGPMQEYEGTLTIVSTVVPLGVTGARLSIDRTNLHDPAVAIAFNFELSFDGGVTWQPWGGATTVGGDVMLRDGSVLAESSFTVEFPQPDNPDRRVRGTVMLNQPAQTAVSVTTFP